ncbi:MAG: DUF5597 domain-containing protein [Eubacterium sp.]|nr:DUF5597 domain-containing protein [Eubacterium sp.]
MSKIISQNGKKILEVNGKPFIMLAGEVHNSASSSIAQMEAIYDKADALGLNSLLVPVTWELIEPEEGTFDFVLVDELILQARRRGKKLAFLWFGSWKNAQCYYAPEWVKKDLKRFRRAEMVKGKNFVRRADFHGMPYSSLSYLCEETCKADAKAFAELMAHIREFDEKEETVISVQVENETGVQISARENSDEADAAFAAAVPGEFAVYMKSHTASMVKDVKNAVEGGAANGSWKEVFGECAEEIFSAYYIASFVNEVAKAGREKYDLPLTANCWLDKGGKPGEYPSGGPVRRMMEVWQYAAPEIDVLAPDIYIPDFTGVCDQFVELDNPLYIPESAVHSYAAPRQVYAVGHYHAMCYATFGFEDMGQPFNAMQGFLFGMDVTDPALKTPQNVEEYGLYAKALQGMMPLLAEKYGTTDLRAISSERREEDELVFEQFGFKIMFGGDNPMLPRTDGVCMILQEAPDTFYLLLGAVGYQYFSTDPTRQSVDVIALEEGHFEEGKFVPDIRLNGDEVVTSLVEKPTLLRLKLFAYE